MAQPEHYDTISIGGGESGNFICWTRAATLKVRTAVIEVKNIGGSCPNIACLPSKNFLFSAEVAHLAEKYTKSGLLKGTYEGIDMSAVRKRKREMVEGLVETFLGVFKETGAELVQGYARLIAPNTVEVELNGGGKRVLSADNIIINTGSRAKIDSTPGLKEAKPLTHIELLELDVLPDHLIILGGGYVGMEFAQTFRRLGSQVSVIERNARIMKKEDEDVSSVLVQVLEREGVQFHTSTQVNSVQGQSGQSVALTGTKNGKPFEIQGSHLLVASGRTPNTVGFGLQEAGVELTATGHVKVNEYLQTTVPSIFAAGVCAGSPDFTHIAFDDFRIVTEYLTKGRSRSTQNRQVPYTLYTNPELAHVGLSEDSARQRGLKYRLAKLPMTWFLRTRTQDQTDGFAKILISSTDDKILGFTALGARAGELLPVIQLAMSAGLPYTSIETLVIAHPTLNENLLTLLAEVPSKD